ncbi:MAG: membrane protein insertase YidC [Firmicutes bacterium]|nr:membrane protein insertase YidC [Bacillota bacterium]
MEIFEFLARGLEWLLQYFVSLTGNGGLAILLLTIVIRIVLYPLFTSQTKSMAVMKELQPEMMALQKKYKDNPQEYQRRALELYKKHKINPFGGCLPMLVQLPVLWALFRVLREFPFGDEPFLWLRGGLGQPDPFYILPILSAVTTYAQMMQTNPDPSQKTMMMVMPIMIGWVSIRFPAGLVLYWVISNLFSMVQQYLVTRGEQGRVKEEDKDADGGGDR